MLLEQLQQMNAQLISLAERYGATRLRVFGSVARGEETSDSDVDFVVELPRGYDMFSQRIALQQDLGDLLHRKVDLVPEHELNTHVRNHVLHEAVAL